VVRFVGVIVLVERLSVIYGKSKLKVNSDGEQCQLLTLKTDTNTFSQGE
jgi:hypothetical protein